MHTRSLLILAVLVLIPQLSIAGESAEWCDQQWDRLSAGQGGGSGQDYNKLLAEWQKLEAKCKGTGLYEARLATVHVLLGQYAKARDVLDPILRNDKLPGHYRAMMEMVRLNADSREAHARTEPDRKQLEIIEKRAARLIEQHPDYSPFYLFLGNLRLELGDYRGAIGPLEKMSQFEDGNRWDVYRNLTIAYANAGDYKAALRSADRTYALNRTVSSHEEFMYACAIAYAATGSIDAAKDTLTLILNKKPQLKNDSRFQQTVQKAKQLSGDKLK